MQFDLYVGPAKARPREAVNDHEAHEAKLKAASETSFRAYVAAMNKSVFEPMAEDLEAFRSSCAQDQDIQEGKLKKIQEEVTNARERIELLKDVVQDISSTVAPILPVFLSDVSTAHFQPDLTTNCARLADCT